MPPDADHNESLHAEIRNAWIHELESSWQTFNHDCLDGRLRRPCFVLLDRAQRTLGQWDGATRQLGISTSHIQSASWHSVQETLRHEMAHQAADELAPENLDREGPHGATFRAFCRRLRVRPDASTAQDTRAEASEQEQDSIRVLRRIEKLLSLADSPNENEANAAFRKARRLMVEHHVAERELPFAQHRSYGVRELGRVAGRHHAWEFVLANILDKFFFVDVIWAHTFDATRAKRGTVLRVYGTRLHLDMAEYVYAFLRDVVDRLWDEYRRERGLPSNRDRLRYRHGLMLGFQSNLTEHDDDLARTRGIVVRGDPELRAFFDAENPRIRRVRRGGEGSEARDHGERDGRSIRIAKPIESRGSGIGFLNHPTSG